MNTANALEVSALAGKMTDTNSLENMVVSGNVSDVCKAKGCWMKIDLPNGETMPEEAGSFLNSIFKQIYQ